MQFCTAKASDKYAYKKLVRSVSFTFPTKINRQNSEYIAVVLTLTVAQALPITLLHNTSCSGTTYYS